MRLTWNKLDAQCRRWRHNQQTIAFTNGCFDLLHFGHVDYLTKSAMLADRLVIGLNSDASVRRIKGNHRPIQDEKSRSRVISALGCVDAVVLFDDDTPDQLIRMISPDVLVKGGDYTLESIVGASYVMSQGGRVGIIPLAPGYSTTAIEKRILRLADPQEGAG